MLPADATPSPWLRRLPIMLVLVLAAFGALVEYRSCFIERRMGDLTVFVRTAWAVRSGEDIYDVADEKGFHYQYAPLLAILMTPLADPPAGVDRTWVLPYPAIAAIWYVLNVAFLAIAVHWLASALEERGDAVCRPQSHNGRWWQLRLAPVLVCLPMIGHTLMRGQVNLLLLLLLCGMVTASLRGRRLQAGLWLAGAICLKLIPAFLLLYPLSRRDGRCLVGCAIGLVAGLGLIPAAAFGPARTATYFEEWTKVLILPGLGAGEEGSRDKELIDATATDSQSFQSTIHNTMYPNWATRPPQPSPLVRGAHWLLASCLTLVTLWAGRRRIGDRAAEVVAFGALVVMMLVSSPVSHTHYFCLALPLTMGVTALWQRSGGRGLSAVLWLVGTFAVAANIVALLPGLELIRDCGAVFYAALLLWLTGIVLLRRTANPPAFETYQAAAKAA
ncbi:MAG TPA: glycosyltransferase family 87 protein [Gemmataceae bacterium]|nr:glycosyltransferase family 87 protein [Gemmataceae bacterium]